VLTPSKTATIVLLDIIVHIKEYHSTIVTPIMILFVIVHLDIFAHIQV